MDWSESKPFDSFEAKKIVHSNPKPASSSVTSAKTLSPQPDQNPWNSKTPEKPMPTLQGVRNGVAALSLTEVRKVAKGQSDQDRSDIRMVPTLSSARKEKYEMMAKDFSDLEFSVRFLKTGGSIRLFRNICRILECEPDKRRFSYGHLAQLKFILPERIRIETAIVCGAHSSGQDLLVTLDFGSGNSYITDVFCSRLLVFLKSHPEVTHVSLLPMAIMGVFVLITLHNTV
ncbi:hypothetical protein L1049_015204 [Liquidambar formosana]|uniref:Uncharacterized protein n=1 Tax=Liquidambar formosana TaxID=63359 RepID=A0AAP0RYH1_LIQFO